ncbi:hypothetical protein GYH30_009433 [Glycine max]|uniref:Retrotransposon gag domain-containing protein n=1 Tax=Glycine max TaxID=3847 RepID=A0A0R0KCT7_SOYBN|nr:hypothetical protein GYH30_009433 [Glycine max]
MKKRGKLQSVVKVLEGHAYDWYKQWEVSNPKVSWEEFQRTVLKKFQARYDLNLPVRVQEREGKSWEQDKRENEGLKIENQNCSKGGETENSEEKKYYARYGGEEPGQTILKKEQRQ